MPLSNFLPEQPVGPDQLAIVEQYRVIRRSPHGLHDDKMVAEGIEAIGIDTIGCGLCSGLRL